MNAQEDIDKIVKSAANKTTSNMGSRKIASIMNKDFKKKGKGITISKNTVCRYLNEHLGKPRKIRKVFSLTNKKKEERLKFCKKIKELKIKGKDIFFTDECIVDCNPFVNEKIRLSKENTEKLKKGYPEAFELINKEADKFPKKNINIRRNILLWS